MVADGSIIINAKLDNREFQVGSKEMFSMIKSLSDSVSKIRNNVRSSVTNYGTAMRRGIGAAREFNAELKRSENEAKSLGTQLKKLGETKLATSEYKTLLKGIQKARTEYEKLKNKAAKMNESGVMRGSDKFKSLYYDLAKAESKMDDLNAKKRDMESSGKAFSYGKETVEYQRMSQQYSQVVDRLNEMRQVSDETGGAFTVFSRNAGHAAAAVARIAGGTALSFLKELATHARNAAIQLMKLAGRAIRSGLHKIGQLAGGAAKRLFGLGHSAKQSGGGFKIGLKNLLRYGLGIRSLFVLFNRLRAAIKEGFGELAKQNPGVKAALDSLKKALNGLKGSLTTAFAPILTAIAPALTTLINLLSTAISYVGMFFAALTGQKTYSKAIGGLDATGAAAKSASGNVKDLKNQLAGFDELDILKATESSNGASDSTGSISFEDAPITAGIRNFVDELKSLFAAGEYEQIGHVIADGINKAIQKAQDFIKWDNIGPTITRGVNAITGAINGLFDGVDWANLGATFGDGLNTITNTLLLWYRRIDWKSIGTSIATALNGLIDRVDWANLGKLIREKAHSLILTLRGAFENFSWGHAGEAFANAVNSLFSDKNTWVDAGKAIDAALNGVLDFAGKFLNKFDPIQMSVDLKAAVKEIDWDGIADKAWALLGDAVKKAGGFLAVLLGGEIQNYDIGDALAEKLAIKNGRTSVSEA